LARPPQVSTLVGVAEETSETRLRALLDAAVAITSELSLDALLERLTQVAAELTDARYAALGVIDAGGSHLERFITTGVDPELRAEIGHPPHGRGILGALIRDAKPLRLHDLAQDPRAAGMPPHHPAMRSFLGVPILLRGVAYGNLYLTEKRSSRDFTAEDEEIVTLLAGQAAVAIENARLYEAATQWSRQLESLNEIGNAIATEIDLDRLLGIVSGRLRELLDARVTVVLLPEGPDRLRFAAAAGDRADALLGQTLLRTDSKSGRVLDRRRSERVDSILDDPEVDRQHTRLLAARTGLWVPMCVRDRAIGVIAVHDRLDGDGRFTDADVRVAESFATRAALAVDLSERVARDSLRRVLEAQEVERGRLARELHDETGQALTSILLGLRSVEETVDDPQSRTALEGLRELVVTTLQDVRRLAVELRPKALDDFGLVPALERLTGSFADQTGIEVDFEAALQEERLPPEVETTLYRVVQESLTNVVKHAGAQRVTVVLTRRDGSALALVEDDGEGFDPDGIDDDRFGLVGMRERLALVGGRLQIESAPGSGTTVAAEVPLR
jgi:signal transduction histidine kinase